MAIIAAQMIGNERRILTKLAGGVRKVSCSCCESCCGYPADGLFAEDYTEEDLPDSVVLNGQILTRDETSYGDTTNGIRLEDNVWAKYEGGVRSEQPCLLSNGVTDLFEDTYTIDFNFIAEDRFIIEQVEVTRAGLCLWAGLDKCGNAVELYNSPFDTAVEGNPQRLVRWSILFSTNSAFDAECVEPEEFIIDKEPPLNSPAGEYGDHNGGTGAIVL